MLSLERSEGGNSVDGAVDVDGGGWGWGWDSS